MYSKDPYEAKHELLIDNARSAGLKYLNDLKGFIEYSNDKKHLKNTIQIVFNDMIADMLSNKRPNPTVIELSIRGRNLIFSLVFIMQYYLLLA